jgi:hypothetical protein
VKRRRDTVSHRALHAQLLEETAKLIGQPIDAMVTRFVALARLRLDTMEMQLIAGNPHAATAAEIDTLRQQLDPYMPKPGLEIRVSYADATDAAPPDSPAVDGLSACRRCRWVPTGVDRWPACPRCGYRHGDDTSAAWQPVTGPTPTTTYATIDDRGHMHAAPSSAAPPAPVHALSDEEQRADAAAEKRRLARISNGVDPGPPMPRVSFNLNADSPSALMRRIERDYGGV